MTMRKRMNSVLSVISTWPLGLRFPVLVGGAKARHRSLPSIKVKKKRSGEFATRIVSGKVLHGA
jgi:hypothetical protein